MKQTIKFAVALGSLVIIGAGVVVMAVTVAINAIGWVIGQ